MDLDVNGLVAEEPATQARSRMSGLLRATQVLDHLVVEGRASIANVVQHIQHMTQVAGSARCIGLGSDMDGGFSTELLPAGL